MIPLAASAVGSLISGLVVIGVAWWTIRGERKKDVRNELLAEKERSRALLEEREERAQQIALTAAADMQSAMYDALASWVDGSPWHRIHQKMVSALDRFAARLPKERTAAARWANRQADAMRQGHAPAVKGKSEKDAQEETRRQIIAKMMECCDVIMWALKMDDQANYPLPNLQDVREDPTQQPPYSS